MARFASLLIGAIILAVLVLWTASEYGRRAPSEQNSPEPVGNSGAAEIGSSVGPIITTAQGTQIAVETVLSGLDTVWDMIWAPDGSIWFSERAGRISRLDLESRTRTLVGQVPNVLETGEAGLMGIALDPGFPRVPWLYAVHSYGSGGAVGNRLVRMAVQEGSLGTPEVLLDRMSGRQVHNGSRIVFGPDRFLYMTMGDAGNRVLSQQSGSLNGKILRLTAEGDPAPGNPFGDHVWSLGHRNPQGLVFHPNGLLYSAEHGQGAEDELNLIEAGRNHGWPAVEGLCNTREEEAYCEANEVLEPLYTWSPTVGISGADVYVGNAIRGWNGDILAVSLGGESLYHLSLSSEGGNATVTDAILEGRYGRLRDVLVGPGGDVYIATSNRDGRGDPSPDDDRILRLSAVGAP